MIELIPLGDEVAVSDVRLHRWHAPHLVSFCVGWPVSDEPANLPEGTKVELQLVTADPLADTDPAERADFSANLKFRLPKPMLGSSSPPLMFWRSCGRQPKL